MGSEVIRLHLATGNAHKVAEFQRLADSLTGKGVARFEIVPAAKMPVVVEDAGTFIGNARKKMHALASRLPAGAWILADDSGVCVDALGGAPGVESAYFAGPEHDPAANLQKLAAAMRPVPENQRSAFFVCVLCVMGPNGTEQSFEGKCAGRMLDTPQGGSGFGYDPLFVPDGFDRTYAQLTEDEKNKISHRGRAWLKFADWMAQKILLGEVKSRAG